MSCSGGGDAQIVPAAESFHPLQHALEKLMLRRNVSSQKSGTLFFSTP
jgi:hypothetical protein